MDHMVHSKMESNQLHLKEERYQ